MSSDDFSDRPEDDLRRRDDEGADRPRRKSRPVSSSSSSSTIWWILGGVGVVLLGCGGCCGGFMWFGWYSMDLVKASNKSEVDGIHAQGLQGGNTDALYANADPAFRKTYTKQEWDEFVRSKPGIFNRDSLWGGFLQHRSQGGSSYVTLVSKPGGMADPGVGIVLKKDKDGTSRLLGVSPGLDRDVPATLRFDPNNPNPPQ